MGKGSPSTGSVFDFKPGTLQVDRPNDGVLGQPLSTPISQPAPLDLTDDGGINIEINPAPDPRSFVGEPAAPSPPAPATQGGIFTPGSAIRNNFLQQIKQFAPDIYALSPEANKSDAPAQSSGFGKGGTRGGSSFGRFGSRGFSKGARGYNQGGSLSAQPSTISPIISVPIPMAALGDRVVPPPSEPQQMADYDYTLNTLKPRPIYPGASFANVGMEGYNTLENIQENQGLSPFDQSQRSMITGTTTGQLSQATANPGNQQGGLASLKDTIGAMS